MYYSEPPFADLIFQDATQQIIVLPEGIKSSLQLANLLSEQMSVKWKTYLSTYIKTHNPYTNQLYLICQIKAGPYLVFFGKTGSRSKLIKKSIRPFWTKTPESACLVIIQHFFVSYRGLRLPSLPGPRVREGHRGRRVLQRRVRAQKLISGRGCNHHL